MIKITFSDNAQTVPNNKDTNANKKAKSESGGDGDKPAVTLLAEEELKLEAWKKLNEIRKKKEEEDKYPRYAKIFKYDFIKHARSILILAMHILAHIALY